MTRDDPRRSPLVPFPEGSGGRPHVVFVLGGLAMGGAEAQLTTLLEAGRGAIASWRVTILTLSSVRDPNLVRRLEALPVEIGLVDRGGRGFAAFFLDLVRWLRAARPDAVHTMLGGTTGTWGRIAARIAGVPRVIHSDRSLAPVRTSWQRRLEPLADRLTDRFLTNARAVADRLVAQGVRRDRIEVIPNGVDLTRFAAVDREAARRALDVPVDAVVAGFLGMLRPEKRPDLLLDALAALKEDDRPDLVLIAGDGVLRPALEARRAQDPWFARHVRMLGVVADTPAFLATLDFLVLTSDTEGLPNAILEAMAGGVPCVATRVSDVPDLVTDNGIVVPPGDAAAIAEALRTLRRATPETRQAMGARGRARVRAAYALESAASRFWTAHAEVLATPVGAWRRTRR